MKILTSIADMRAFSERVRKDGKTIGFVPTMGGLHQGHLSLVEQSFLNAQVTVVSVFVNPTQFGENEDLDIYPRDFKGDKAKLDLAGVDVMFCPEASAMYPAGYKTFVNVETITGALCGKSRPGFFQGVATVVLKLFNIVRPHKAFFGEKDWQQLAVVETLVRDLNLDVDIVRCPIVREKDGLAMSSRNEYLSGEQRIVALSLSQALETARDLAAQGETSAATLRQEITRILESRGGTEVDYISICDPENFIEQDTIQDPSLIALAVRVGDTRLIDNCLVRRAKCSE